MLTQPRPILSDRQVTNRQQSITKQRLVSNKRLFLLGLTFLLSAALISVDQLIKRSLQIVNGIIPNPQGSFSLPLPPLLITTSSVIIIAALFYLLLQLKNNPFQAISLILLIAGGTSNLIDRIIYGYVRDISIFASLHFNPADIYILTAALLLFLDLLINPNTGQ